MPLDFSDSDDDFPIYHNDLPSSSSDDDDENIVNSDRFSLLQPHKMKYFTNK